MVRKVQAEYLMNINFITHEVVSTKLFSLDFPMAFCILFDPRVELSTKALNVNKHFRVVVENDTSSHFHLHGTFWCVRNGLIASNINRTNKLQLLPTERNKDYDFIHVGTSPSIRCRMRGSR